MRVWTSSQKRKREAIEGKRDERKREKTERKKERLSSRHTPANPSVSAL